MKKIRILVLTAFIINSALILAGCGPEENGFSFFEWLLGLFYVAS